MCHRVQCARCGKPSWIGCGRHVERALFGVPAAERCVCPRSLLARLLGWRTTPAPVPSSGRER
ncbi:MAG TPA: hypothetical protein VJ648_12550 [Vicinamibacteria bacterium]|nr:hypothetical protein [Vicinamibacteria bacterium]